MSDIAQAERLLKGKVQAMLDHVKAARPEWLAKGRELALRVQANPNDVAARQALVDAYEEVRPALVRLLSRELEDFNDTLGLLATWNGKSGGGGGVTDGVSVAAILPEEGLLESGPIRDKLRSFRRSMRVMRIQAWNTFAFVGSNGPRVMATNPITLTTQPDLVSKVVSASAGGVKTMPLPFCTLSRVPSPSPNGVPPPGAYVSMGFLGGVNLLTWGVISDSIMPYYNGFPSDRPVLIGGAIVLVISGWGILNNTVVPVSGITAIAGSGFYGFSYPYALQPCEGQSFNACWLQFGPGNLVWTMGNDTKPAAII